MVFGGDGSRTDEDFDTDRLWLVGGVAALGVVAWAKRGDVLAAGVPYGLAEAKRTPFHGDWQRPDVVTGWRPAPGWHVTTQGWVALAVLAVGAVGLLVCVAAGAAWVRWQRGGGVEAVPPIPAGAAAMVVGSAVFAAGLIFVPDRIWLSVLVAAVVGAAVGWWASVAGGRWRRVAGFAGRADQVLGHGHPGTGRVRVRGWRRDEGGPFPARIEAVCGPGWQHAPGELAELGRYAREVGWPAYDWGYDALRKRVTGRPVGGAAQGTR